jgi:transposase
MFVTGVTNYLADTPKEIRAFAVKEYVTNRNNCSDIFEDNINKEIYLRETYPNREEKNITIPNMTFKKKKYGQSITITKDCVKLKDGKIKIYPEKFSDDPLVLIKRSKRDKRLKKILDGILYHDIKIIKTITNKFYICFTDDIKFKKNIKVDVSRSCAIDPGFRTQGTIYAENKIEEIGPNMYEKLTPLINERNELNKIYRRSYKKRNNLNDNGLKEYEKSKKNYRMINEKIKNMVNDLHYKAIAKLTNEYTLISIPILNTMEMQKSKQLNKKTKNIISILRQRTFVKRLEAKSKEKEITTRRVTEIMTTKECSNCFSINDPGASERYNCKNCNAKMGRDINASKNIYIQQIGKIIEELLYLN